MIITFINNLSYLHFPHYPEEIENLEVELEARAKRYDALEADHGAALDEKKKTDTKSEKLKKQAHTNQERITRLEDELKAKDELVRRGPTWFKIFCFLYIFFCMGYVWEGFSQVFKIVSS